MKQNKSKLKQAIKDAQIVTQSGRSPTSTKKGPGRVHVQGYGRKVRDAMKDSIPGFITATYKDFL